MYLTRFELNTARRQAHRLLGSPRAMHAAVLAAYPTGAAGGRVLWRLDQLSRGTFLYIVGPQEPDLTHLVEQAGWPSTTAWETRDYGAVLDVVEVGRRFGFRLSANPVHAVRGEQGENGRGRRLGHVTAQQQLDWFVRRTPSWGIDVQPGGEAAGPTVHVVSRKLWRFSHGDRRDVSNSERRRAPVTLNTAVYEGTLVVRDAALLRQTLVGGAGPAKAYGCGLLTLAPAG